MDYKQNRSKIIIGTITILVLCFIIVFGTIIIVRKVTNNNSYDGYIVPPKSEASEDGVITAGSIKEEVVLSDELMTVTVLDLVDKDESDFYLNLLIENNSEQELKLSLDSHVLAVNDFMINGFLSEDVSANSSIEVPIELSKAGLRFNNIEAVASIDFILSIRDLDYNALFTSELITINTSIADEYKQTVDKKGNVLIDNEYITVIDQGLSANEYSSQVNFYIENKTEKSVFISFVLTSINGYMNNDSDLNVEVLPGKSTYEIAYFSGGAFPLNSFEKQYIEEYEFQVEVWDLHTWDYIYFSDFITIEYKGEFNEELLPSTEGDIILDNKYVKVVEQGREETNFGVSSFNFYIENYTDESAFISFEEIKINGEVVDDYYGMFSIIAPEKKEYAMYEFNNNEYIAGSSVYYLEFKIVISDWETGDTIFESDIIVLNYNE